jgi:hypothetical protein
MKTIAVDGRSLLTIIYALQLQLKAMEKDLEVVPEGSENDDARSDLLNDIGYLRSLIGHLEKERA